MLQNMVAILTHPFPHIAPSWFRPKFPLPCYQFQLQTVTMHKASALKPMRALCISPLKSPCVVSNDSKAHCILYPQKPTVILLLKSLQCGITTQKLTVVSPLESPVWYHGSKAQCGITSLETKLISRSCHPDAPSLPSCFYK